LPLTRPIFAVPGKNELSSPVVLRDYRDTDAVHVNGVALAAFEQFSLQYSDWAAMSSAIERMSALADGGEIVVAELEEKVVGAVAYIPPGRPKAAYFQTAWPIIRMLVVEPTCRGRGVGRALTEECLRRAKRDGSRVIALHTSPIMTVALSMYIKMGFTWQHDAPLIYGVPYAVYLKRLDA
jgi:ribosomal protein S18 acetylase RimI-like enzyme